MTVTTTLIPTRHGRLSVAESRGTDLPIVLLHGNSASKRVFEKQLRAPLADRYRMIAIDLPGHGASENATDPAKTYSLPGYAAAVREAIDALGVARAAVFGWSLGGHVAYELASSWKGTVGVVTSGAPPLSADPAVIQAAFNPDPVLPLLFSEHLGDGEVAALASAIAGPGGPEFLAGDVRRADGRARRSLLESVFRGEMTDERSFVANARVPVAVLDGAADPFVNAGYVDGLPFSSLWEGEVHRVDGAGHLPFWQSPRAVNALLLRFLREVARTATAPRRRATPSRRERHLSQVA